MIPEGIEFQSIESIVEKMKNIGFNFIRHPYAIQMIDQVYEGGDVKMIDSLTAALGQENGTRVAEGIIKNNPSFTKDTTRFEILSHVAEAEANAGMLMHLDNHISQAQWCCSMTDGNAWFGDKQFNIDNWVRGLTYMANWAKDHKNILSISLRNELRKSELDPSLQYNWVNWWGNVTNAAESIHEANPDLLITISGLNYDIDLSALTAQSNLLTAPSSGVDAIPGADSMEPMYADLGKTKFGQAKKAVLELHAYKMSYLYNNITENCPKIEAALFNYGMNALGIGKPDGCDGFELGCADAKVNLPVLLTEFGDAQDDSYSKNTMQNCLRQFTTKNKIGWNHWAIAGSYRIREGIQVNEDTWGMLTKDFSEYRSSDAVNNFFIPWVKEMGTTNLEL